MSVLQKIFRSAERHEAARQAAQADPLIARIVHATDKRLAYVKGYRERLRGPLAAARSSLEHAIAAIPGPTEVGAAAWSRDNTVRALFARANDAPAPFSADPATRAFLEANAGSTDCYALLALAPVHRRVIAAALQGDMVQADVARTTVSFTQPHILAPGGDEASVRTELVAKGLEYLALLALQRVGAMRAERHTLEKERALLSAELQLARRRGTGLAALVGADDAPPRGAAAVEQELERTIEELQRSASRELLPCLLDEMVEAFQRHGERIGVEPCELTLDSMNFEVAPSPQALTPAVAMLRLARRGVFAVLVVRFPRSELRAPASLADAEKYL